MNKIPAPNTDYGTSPYGGSAQGSIDLGDDQGSYDPAIESYHATLRSYADSLMSFYSNLQAGDPRRQTLEAYRRQTASLASQYGFEDIAAETEGRGFGSNWDPLTGNIYGDSAGGSGGGEVSANGGSVRQYGEMIWQDSNRVKWDGLDPVTYVVDQKSEARQQDFFQSDVTIQLPYHGAVANAEAVDDDSSTPPAKMLKVTVTMPDGSTRMVCVHNVTDKSKIQLQSADQNNIKLDASLTSSPLAAQVTVGDLSSTSTDSTGLQGDQPAKRKDGKLGYDGDSFDIYSTEDGKDKYISARGTVGFHASSNTEYWTVEWKDGKYVVSVYDNSDTKNSKAKETFFMDDMTNLKATFDIDPTHIEFKAPLGDAKDPHQINTSDDHGKKLSFDEGNGSATVHKPGEPLHAGDTPPDPNSVSNGQATWTGGSSNVEIHADPSDGINTYNVTTSGAVLLHGTTPNDKVVIEHQFFEGPQRVTFTSPDGTQKTFLVGNTAKGKPPIIIIDSTPDKMSGTGVDEFHIGNSFDAANSEANDLMERIKKTTGADEETILEKLLEKIPGLSDYDKLITKGGNKNGKLDMNELEKAIKDGVFPPKNPDENLIKFIYEIDSNFRDHVNGIDIKDGNATMMRQATQRLVDVLHTLYPNETNISAAFPQAHGGDWALANDIYFGNGQFTFTGESNDTQNTISFGWIKQPTS